MPIVVDIKGNTILVWRWFHFVLAGGEYRLPIHEYVRGELARVVHFERPCNRRCPSIEFLEKEIESKALKKFKGQFHCLTSMGARYCNHERFKPLHDKGKPLWEFKEGDHRLYCARLVKENRLIIALFNGWIKDRRGRTEKEEREIEKAVGLYEEFKVEFQGGSYDVLAAIKH